MEKPPYLSGYLEKKGEKGMLKTWKVRWFQQDGRNLYYYEDKHFKSTDESYGCIDLSSLAAVEAVAPANKKDKAKMISLTTKFGRTFLLREPNDDVRKAQEWVQRIDEWRKWIKDGGSDSPPIERKETADLRASSAEIKPLARGLSGAIDRTKGIMKKTAQGMGTLMSTTVAKGKAEETDVDIEGVRKCGWLVKKGQKRWFALKDGVLLWFKDAQTSANTVSQENAAGSLPLRDGCIVRKVQDKSALVVISPSGKPYELVAFDNGTRDVWLNYLTDACGGARARAPTIRAPQKLKGWLKRKAAPGKLKPWKRMWVTQQDSELVFFNSDEPNEEPQGSLNLFDINNVEVTYEDGVSPTFEIRTTHAVFYLMAINEEDLEYWTSGLLQYWEKKKARGGSKSAADKPEDSGKTHETQVSDTFVVKTPIGESGDRDDAGDYDSDDSDEEARRRKLEAREKEEAKRVLDGLEALEHSDDEDAGPLKQKAAPEEKKGAVRGDDDFDSLMDALGSEKSKISMRVSRSKIAMDGSNKDIKGQNKSNNSGNNRSSGDGGGGLDDSMDDMFSAAKETASKQRKPTVVIGVDNSSEVAAAAPNSEVAKLLVDSDDDEPVAPKGKEPPKKAGALTASSSKVAGAGPAKMTMSTLLDSDSDEDLKPKTPVRKTTVGAAKNASLSALPTTTAAATPAAATAPVKAQQPSQLVMKKPPPVVEADDDWGAMPSFDDFDDSSDKVNAKKKAGATPAPSPAPSSASGAPLSQSSRAVGSGSGADKSGSISQSARSVGGVSSEGDEKRSRSRTEIQRRLELKQSELKKSQDDVSKSNKGSVIEETSDDEGSMSSISRKKKEEEEAAARKKKEQEEAAARKKKEDEATAAAAAAKKKKEDEERKKKEEEEAAARKKKEQEEAAARKKKEEEEEARKKSPQKAAPPVKKKRTKRVRRAKQEGPWLQGDRVMAQFVDDELWYKARIEKVLDKAGTRFEVLFLEYGNKQRCDEDMIQPIPDEDLTDGDEVEITDSDDAGEDEDQFMDQLDSMMSLPPVAPDDGDDDDGDDREKGTMSSLLHSPPSKRNDAKKPAADMKKLPLPRDDDDDDDDDDDLPQPPPAVDEDDDDDSWGLASPKKGPEPAKKGPEPAKKGPEPAKKGPEPAKKALEMKKSPSVIEAEDEDDDDWGGLSASKKKVAAEPPAAAKKGASSANLAAAAKKPEPAAAAKKAPAPIPIEDDDDYDWGLGEDVGKIGKDAKKGGKGDDDAGKAGARKNAEERKKLQAASDKGPDHDRSGLFEAASKGDLKMVKSILNEGKVYVDYRKRKEPKGWSALHFAVQAGQEAVVEFLLQKGADVDLMDGREKPVLHKAVSEHCKVSILKKLLDAKPNLFATSDTGNNILHECRSAEAARLILKSLDKARQKELLTMQGQDGFSPLHSVATDRGPGGRAVCEVYVELFPDTLELEDMREETPLFAAARSEAFPALAALLEAGANLGKRNAKGQSVFQVALHARKDFSAEVLISGATVNEELLQELTEMQLDMQLESELGRGSDDESDEEEQIRVALVKHHLDMFKSAFKTDNVGRQIVSTLRLGQEYLISPDFYNQAVICMNGARALCTKNLGFSGLGMKLMLEAVTTEEVNSLKRARYTKNEKNFTRHNPTTASDYSMHQKCHFMFCGKLALTDPSDDIANVLRESIESAEETGFPSIVLEKMGELYEDDW